MPEKPTKSTVVHVSHAGLQPDLASILHVMVVEEKLQLLGYLIFMFTKGSCQQETKTSLPVITPSFLHIKWFRTATFSINTAFCLSKTIKKNLPAVIYYRRSLLDPFPARESHRLNTPLITEINENWGGHVSEKMALSIGGIRLILEQLEQWEKEILCLVENEQVVFKLGQEGREGIFSSRADLTKCS